MQHKYCFEVVHHSLEDIHSAEGQLFDGIPTVLGGDFAQILLVVHKGNQDAIINACIQWSFLWPQLRLLTLCHNMQVHIGEENQRFAQWVDALLYDSASSGWILLPVSIMQFWTLETFCRHVFSRLQLE